MSDYSSLSNEFQVIQYIIKNQLNDMTFLLEKTDSFKNGIILIEKNLKSIQGNSDEFDFINPIFNNYIKEIHQYTEEYSYQISLPIKQFIESFTFATNNSINSFSEIKKSLSENRLKVLKAKEDYYDYIKSNKNLENEKNDNNELFKAKKDNYAQLYKYEINKMNEIIDQNNQKYFEIFKNLDRINFSANSIVKNIFTKLIKNIASLGNIFIKFSEKLQESLNNNLKHIENNSRYASQIDEKTKMRFNYEEFEEYNYIDLSLRKSGKSSTMKENSSTFKLKRIMSIQQKGFDDFEIIESPVEIMDQKIIKEKISQLDNFVKKFPSEVELIPSEISELMNILKEETFNTDQTFSYIFLNNLKKLFKNRVISFKNRQNFIHLSNIMNNICIKENNTKTFNAIIQVSQMIKYEKSFLFSMIQRKNHFFSTKTFWIRIIQNNLINNINDYVNKLINESIKPEKKHKKEKFKDSKLVKMHLANEIYNFNKLNEEQMKKLDEYAFENICIILSKSIPGMCSFLVPESISIEIINHYANLFNFNQKTKSYFLNILATKNVKNSLYHIGTTENSINNEVHKKLFIISSALKYLGHKDFINLIHLNKVMTPHIKKSIFKFLLSNEKLSIEKRIKLWSIILNIKEKKKIIKYSVVKNIMKEKLENNLILPDSDEGKNVYTIQVDLLRTPFINSDKTHTEKIGWILKCLNLLRPDIGYFQGMNFLAAFFYQLLDYDEEETFYFLFAIEDETNYRDIYIEDLKRLNLFYTVLDKIINLYKPELYYKFVDSYINTNFYSTTWFVTLFTNINCVFDKQNAPKYVLMVLENYFLDGFSAIFASGFTIINYHIKKIMELGTDNLITFMISEMCEQDIFKNEHFDEIKKYYEKNSKNINEFLINKLLDIIIYENENSYLLKN